MPKKSWGTCYVSKVLESTSVIPKDQFPLERTLPYLFKCDTTRKSAKKLIYESDDYQLLVVLDFTHVARDTLNYNCIQYLGQLIDNITS